MDIKKQFIRYVSQNMLGMLGMSLYILADTYFISKAVGADGITALNLVLPVYNLIFAIGAMIGVGSAIRFVIERNKKNPEAERRLIYTTNAIEGFNRQLRKVTKSKTVFPSDDSLLKMLYLATMDITKKWTGHRQDWGQIHSQLEIYFEERLAGRNL